MVTAPDSPPLSEANPVGRRAQVGRWLRYLVSGGAAALVYAAVTTLVHTGFGMGLVASGALGYLASMPCAYLLHRYYSFSSRQMVARELPKFALQSMFSAGLSGVLPALLGAAGLPLPAALALTCLAVPLVNYFVLSLWVFHAR